MSRQALLVAFSLLFVGASQAEDQGWQRSSIYLTTAVDIDSTGKITHMDPLPAKDADGKAVPPALGALAESSIAKWEFTPAQADGEPAPAHTFVHGVFEFRTNGKSYDGRFVPTGSGPKIIKNPPPLYPSWMVSSRTQARLTVLARVETDGHISDIRLESAQTSEGRPASDFVKSTMKAIASWRAEPETVAGHGVRAWVRIPVNFYLRDPATGMAYALDLQRSSDSPKPVSDKPVTDKPVTDKDMGDEAVAVDSPIKLHPQSP
jgi:TonB family protein